MKLGWVTFLVFLIVELITHSAFASPNDAMLCFSTDSKYQFSLNETQQKAQVLKEFRAVRFGILTCNPAPNLRPDRARLFCHSENVADAGFSAILYSGDETHPTTVKLSELWFGGEKLIDYLPCIEGSGSGYLWELQPSPQSNTVTF